MIRKMKNKMNRHRIHQMKVRKPCQSDKRHRHHLVSHQNLDPLRMTTTATQDLMVRTIPPHRSPAVMIARPETTRIRTAEV